MSGISIPIWFRAGERIGLRVGIIFTINIGVRVGRDNRLRAAKSAQIGGLADKCFGLLGFVLDNGFERGTLFQRRRAHER